MKNKVLASVLIAVAFLSGVAASSVVREPLPETFRRFVLWCEVWDEYYSRDDREHAYMMGQRDAYKIAAQLAEAGGLVVSAEKQP